MNVKRNEIYLANLGKTIGSEEKGIRPVLIIQNDFGNKYSPTTIVVPITKRIEKKYRLPTHVQIEPFGKMRYKAIIMAEQIKVIDKRRIIYYIDELPRIYQEKVNNSLKISIGLIE